MKILLLITIMMFLSGSKTFSQLIISPLTKSASNNFSKVSFVPSDSGLTIRQYHIRGCKIFFYTDGFITNKINAVIEKYKAEASTNKKDKFLSIHGNISYDFFYRSKIDTPFNQNNLQQHTEKVYLDMVLLEKYPVKASFVLRQGNSTYARNFADLNLQFDPYSYRKYLQQELLNNLSTSLGRLPELKAIEALLLAKEKQLQGLKGWLENPATLQKIIEERERAYSNQFITTNSFGQPTSQPILMATGNRFRNSSAFTTLPSANPPSDSTSQSFSKQYANKQVLLDSLQKNIKWLQQQQDSIHNSVQKNIGVVKQLIARASNENELTKIAAANGLEMKDRSKLQQKLAGLRNLSIGRSMVNYTELTAKDISITGLNIVYNPSYYVSFAAGKIDYRFRDFYNKRLNNNNNGQYLLLGRFGFGNPDKRALIMTVFKGQKNPSAFILNDTVPNHTGIIGYSIEAILKKDAHTGISLELAKSTKPVIGGQPGNKQLADLWHFADQSNTGINIKGQVFIARTNTSFSGFIRKTGQNFQSFSLFTYNSDQLSWLIKAE